MKPLGIDPLVKSMRALAFTNNAPQPAKAVNRNAIGAQKGAICGTCRLIGNNGRILEPCSHRRLISVKHILPDRGRRGFGGLLAFNCGHRHIGPG